MRLQRAYQQQSSLQRPFNGWPAQARARQRTLHSEVSEETVQNQRLVAKLWRACGPDMSWGTRHAMTRANEWTARILPYMVAI